MTSSNTFETDWYNMITQPFLWDECSKKNKWIQVFAEADCWLLIAIGIFDTNTIWQARHGQLAEQCYIFDSLSVHFLVLSMDKMHIWCFQNTRDCNAPWLFVKNACVYDGLADQVLVGCFLPMMKNAVCLGICLQECMCLDMCLTKLKCLIGARQKFPKDRSKWKNFTC